MDLKKLSLAQQSALKTRLFDNQVNQVTETLRESVKQVIIATEKEPRKLSFSAGTKEGIICLRGLGRFPVSLYGNQWAKLVATIQSGEFEKYAAANGIDLSATGADIDEIVDSIMG